MTQDILVHTEAGVMTVTINRLDKKNSLTAAMYAAMADALDAAKADASVRVVVFQGDVAIFSAGNDIGDFLQQPPATQDSPVFRFLHRLAADGVQCLGHVAAVHGSGHHQYIVGILYQIDTGHFVFYCLHSGGIDRKAVHAGIIKITDLLFVASFLCHE